MSNGSKGFMNRPIVGKLCECEGTEKQTYNLENKFHVFFLSLQCCVFALPVYYLSEGFKARLKSFLELIVAEATMSAAKKLPM